MQVPFDWIAPGKTSLPLSDVFAGTPTLALALTLALTIMARMTDVFADNPHPYPPPSSSNAEPIAPPVLIPGNKMSLPLFIVFAG